MIEITEWLTTKKKKIMENNRFALLLFVPTQISKQKYNETYVCIFTGEYAYSYHSKNTCSGLKRCKADIKKVTISQAKQLGRKPCQKCY